MNNDTEEYDLGMRLSCNQSCSQTSPEKRGPGIGSHPFQDSLKQKGEFGNETSMQSVFALKGPLGVHCTQHSQH